MILRNVEELGVLSNTDEINPWSEIGIGKPLLIRLHTLYLGDMEHGWFGNKPDVIVCSRVKNDNTFDAAPRAINQLYRKREKKEILSPSARNEGTSLIYYSKAFDTENLYISIEVMSDNFPEKAVNNIAKIIGDAGSVPIFNPISTYLLIGSKIIEGSSKLLNRIAEGDALLVDDLKIVDGIAGLRNTKAGFKLAVNESDESYFRNQNYEIQDLNGDNNLKLCKDGKPYSGDKPYMILSIDGASKDEYEDFSPSLINASILNKFYGVNGDDSGPSLDNELLEAINDFSYAKKISKAKKELKNADENRRTELNQLIEVYEENILNKGIFDIKNDSN